MSAQTIDPADPFLDDAVAGFNARTFYMGVEDSSQPPSSTRKEVWNSVGDKHSTDLRIDVNLPIDLL